MAAFAFATLSSTVQSFASKEPRAVKIADRDLGFAMVQGPLGAAIALAGDWLTSLTEV